MWQIKIVILSMVLVGAVLWILFFTNLLRIVSVAKKDKYLVIAFHDEFFLNIKIKAGYNGYTTMIISCLIFMIGSILLNVLSIRVDFPAYISCEIILLLGVITDDISKILLIKG
ncbi:MAG: hypothetical protein Q8920_07015 [Bacillota bacterium]|nr:hypothetical protein [Bacillota bacterium]